MKLGLMQTFDQNERLEAEYPPLGLGYLSSYLKKYLDFHDIVYEKRPEELVTHHPDIIGLSCVTQYYNLAVEQAQLLKRDKNAPIVIGGGHITCLPESLDPIFDVGVLGEGEETFLELMQLFIDKKWAPEYWAKVAGVCYRDESGAVVRTQTRPAINPVDKIPPPDRELLGDRWQIPFHQFISMVSSRGCPFDCVFCSSQMHFEGPTRYFSAEYVINELQEIIDRWNPASITFYDDLFIANPTRLKEISALIEERGFADQITFYCSTRANILSIDKLEDMRRMNVVGVNFGAESASDKILNYLKGGNITAAHNQKALELFAEYGIKPGCSFVVGSPPETAEDIQMTLDFVRKNRNLMAAAEFYPAVGYPGTPLWRDSVANGKIQLPVQDWTQFSLSIQGNGDKFWDRYIYINEKMSLDTFKMYYYQLQEESLQLAVKKAKRWIGELERELHGHISINEEHQQFRNRRAVKAVTKILEVKDRLNPKLRAARAADEEERLSHFTQGSAYNCG